MDQIDNRREVAAGVEIAPLAQEPPRQLALHARLYFAFLLGLLIGFPTLLPSAPVAESAARSMGLSVTGAWTLVTVIDELVRIGLIFGIVLWVEQMPLGSLGLGRVTPSDLGLGLALFAACLLSSGLFVLALRIAFPHSMRDVAPEQLGRFLMLPVPCAIAIAVAAGFAEEIEERGFVLDRLRRLSGSTVFSVAAVLALSLGAHIPFWGWRYAVLLGPAQLLLILFYLWRGSLWPNIVAHALIDTLPVTSRVALIAVLSLMRGAGYHRLLGDFHSRYDDYAGAAAEYTRALAAAPDDPDLLGSRAEVEVMRHHYAQALADIDRAMRQEPGDPGRLMQRAMVYLYAGHYQAAKAAADQAVAAAPKDADFYQQRASIEKWLNQPELEIADLNRAINLSKSPEAELYAARGDAFYRKGDRRSALRDLLKADSIGPAKTETLAALAETYLDNRQYQESVRVLTRLLASSPDDTHALLSRGVAYSAAGQYREALKDFQAAVKSDAGSPEAINDLAWFLSTNPEPDLRDGTEALKLANRACDLTDWTNADYIDTLAAAYAESGNFNEAVVWARRALDLAAGSKAEDRRVMGQRLDLYLRRLPCRESGHR